MKMVVNTNNTKSKINKNIYGHFSEHLGRCIYEGLYVGEDSEIPNVKGMRTDVVDALREIKIPVLRWPGGCFADEYHWKDGIGPKESRKRMINTHWGGVVEDNSFGTHEFLELCRQLECEPYINGNVGSGTVQEMSEWVEYMTFDGLSPMAALREQNGKKEPWKIKYFGVGNENWGCGGNMRPSYYADLYRRFATYVRNYGDNKVFKIACGANVDDYQWTREVMEIAGRHMDAITLHYYTVPGSEWDHKGSATDFDNKEYYITMKKTLRMEELLQNHIRIIKEYDKDNKVGLIVDEWGTWYDVEPGTNPGFLYQQNTIRDALVAASTLNIFNNYSEKVIMANIAQMVNVLQAVILTEGEKMVLTPTYHVFNMYKKHQEATNVELYLETKTVGIDDCLVPNLNSSASIDDSGDLFITVANLSLDESYDVEAVLAGFNAGAVSAEIISGKADDYNDFENGSRVVLKQYSKVSAKGETLSFTIPPTSILGITIKRA